MMEHLTELSECARATRAAEGASTAKATAVAKPKAKATAAAKPKANATAAAKPKAKETAAAKPKATAKPKAKASPGEARRIVDSSDEEELDSSDEEEPLAGKSINEMTVDEALEAAGLQEWTSSSAKRTAPAKAKRTPVVNVDCDLQGEDSDSEDDVPLAKRKQKK